MSRRDGEIVVAFRRIVRDPSDLEDGLIKRFDIRTTR